MKAININGVEVQPEDRDGDALEALLLVERNDLSGASNFHFVTAAKEGARGWLCQPPPRNGPLYALDLSMPRCMVWVYWDPADPRVHGQHNGSYYASMFREVISDAPRGWGCVDGGPEMPAPTVQQPAACRHPQTKRVALGIGSGAEVITVCCTCKEEVKP